MMKIALLHLNVCSGPAERNLENIYDAACLAAEQGAHWIVTPEVAWQGYFFATKGQNWPPPVLTEQTLAPLRQLAKTYQVTIFLGCAEQGEKGYYNSCFVIGPQGEALGRHRKLRVIGKTEEWATPGTELKPQPTAPLKAGVLICADSWYMTHGLLLRDLGAEVLVVPAAWPPGVCGPGDCWERCSAITGLPVWVCNQTGNQEALAFGEATSVVVAEGTTKLSYHGKQAAVLLFGWEERQQKLLSKEFQIIPLA